MQSQKQQEKSVYPWYKVKYCNVICAKLNYGTQHCYLSHLKAGTFIAIYLGFLLRLIYDK